MKNDLWDILRLAVVTAFVAAAIVAVRAARVVMPYRVLETDLRRWSGIFYGAVLLACGCAAVWILVARTRGQRRVGWIALVGVLLAFFFAGPSWVHSVISIRNICIGQMRQIDGAKGEWAAANGKKVGDEVDLNEVAAFLAEKKIPVCPTGGAYRFGKVGEEPRCLIAEHRESLGP